MECAIRKLEEETGIKTTDLIELDRIVHEAHQSLYVEFLYVADCNKDIIKLQKDETNKSSIDWHENNNDYSHFILYMIRVFYRCYKLLDKNVFGMIDKKLNKSERIEYLLLNTFVPLKKQQIMEQLPDVSENFVETILSRLIQKEKLSKSEVSKMQCIIENNLFIDENCYVII